MDVSRKKKGWIYIFSIIIIIIILGLSVFNAFTTHRMKQIPLMTFEEMMFYTTKNNEQAIITVGTIKGNEITYTLYGNNASILPKEEHTYEIGSITKTFTASLMSKAMEEGRIELNDSIDKYIDLPVKEYYPTIKKLVTHTSGYKAHYFDRQMALNFLRGRENDFYGISSDRVIKKAGQIELENKNYNFGYSNFGYAVVGALLTTVYDTEFTQQMNDFIANDLKLENTKVSDGKGNLSGYWDWKSDDAYIPVGALTSTISDMLQYLELQLSGDIPYLTNGHEIVAEVNATSSPSEDMNIRMDAVGIGWMIDYENNII